MKKLLFIILAIGISITQSCDNLNFETDKIADIKQSATTLALPLAKSVVTLEQLIPKGEEVDKFVKYGDDGFITLMFEDSHSRIKARDFFKENLGTIPPGANIVDLPILEPIKFPVETTLFYLNFDELKGFEGFHFANPKITVSIQNYWAVPFRIKFNQANYYISEFAKPQSITGTAISSWHNINIPADINSPANTNIILDKTNSNFTEIMSQLPHSMEFGLMCETQAEAVGKTFKINLDSENSVDVSVEVPMEVRIDNVEINDTVSFDIASEFDNEILELEYAKFNLMFDNGFPINADVQMFLADELGNIIDKLTNENIAIKAGNSVNGTNIPVESIIELLVDGVKTKSLEKTKKILVKITMNTNGEVVKLYKQYSLGLRIGVMAKTTPRN